jgi:hypothetical protein
VRSNSCATASVTLNNGFRHIYEDTERGNVIPREDLYEGCGYRIHSRQGGKLVIMKAFEGSDAKQVRVGRAPVTTFNSPHLQ